MNSLVIADDITKLVVILGLISASLGIIEQFGALITLTIVGSNVHTSGAFQGGANERFLKQEGRFGNKEQRIGIAGYGGHGPAD